MAEHKHWLSAGKPFPALILLFGIILTMSGILYAMTTIEIHGLNNPVALTVYPYLYSGVLVSILGVVTAVFGFLLFYGKIKLSPDSVSGA